MAVVFANETTKRTSTLVSDFPENILLDPQLNGRIESTNVDDLAADIEKNGQRTPVLIRKNDEGQPVLVYGHRRWRAVKQINARRAKAGEELIRLECTYENLTEEEAFKAAIAENRFRKDTTPMDDTHNIGIWQKRFKRSLEEIAAIYFPEAKKPEEKATALKWVKDRAALTELAPEAAQAVREGKVKITAAVQLTRLSKDKQKEVIAQTKNTLKGKTRVKVSNVIAAKGKKVDKAVAPPVVRVNSTVYASAEALACTVEAWLRNEPKAEKHMLHALKEYRTLVPLPKAEGEAA